MISAIELLLALIVGIALIVRWRLFPQQLHQRIHDELHGRLKASAPHLPSSFDGVGYDSGSSTSR